MSQESPNSNKLNQKQNPFLLPTIGIFAGAGISLASMQELRKPKEIINTQTKTEFKIPNSSFPLPTGIHFPITKLMEDPATAILSPISIEGTSQTKETSTFTIVIPMEYFKALPTNPQEAAAQQKKITDYIKSEVTKQNLPIKNTPFKNETLAKGIEEKSHTGYNSFKIISIDAGSSFEYAKGGVKSVLNVDSQNVELAKARLESVKKSTQENFGRIDWNTLKLKANEIQLSLKDYETLVKYGEELKIKGGQEEIIFEVAKRINSGEITDPSITKILTEKRFVKIQFSKESNHDNVYIIGLPLLLLLTPLLSRVKLPAIEKKSKVPKPITPKLTKIDKIPTSITDKFFDGYPEYLPTIDDKFIAMHLNKASRADGLKLSEIITTSVNLFLSKIKIAKSEQERNEYLEYYLPSIAFKIKSQIQSFDSKQASETQYPAFETNEQLNSNNTIRTYKNNSGVEMPTAEYNDYHLEYYAKKQAAIILNQALKRQSEKARLWTLDNTISLFGNLNWAFGNFSKNIVSDFRNNTFRDPLK